MDFLNEEFLDDIMTDWTRATGMTATVMDAEGNLLTEEVDFPEDIFTYSEDIIIDHTKFGSVMAGQTEETSDTDAVVAAAKLLAKSISLFAEQTYIQNKYAASNSTLMEQIRRTVELVQEINEKSLQLDKIENKQKILSLNASIEAARAGEFGRGFAVVANEVGKSAANSGEINKSIKQSLKQLTSAIDEIEMTSTNI